MPRTRPTVCVVGPLTPETLFSLEHPLLLEMHAQFASRGIGWEQVFDARLGGRNPAPRLAQLVNARRQACWILFGAPEPIQRWFATADVHALVLGSGVAGLNLPSVDLDYGAIGWHAAGAILRHGHTRVALVLPARPLPGDIASREAFLRYVDQRVTGVTVTNCEAPVDPAQFRATLRRLLGSSRRPTALLSLRPSLTLTLLTHVLGEGLRVPEDVSIVTRDTHPLIESALPELTRYISPVTKRATRTVRIASALLAGRRVQPIPSLVTASFVPGATLAAAP